MSDLPWRVAWITGASTGIGREVALLMARRGVIVAASARSADKLQGLGHGIHAYPLDVTDPQAVQDAHDRICRELGAIDLAVLAAGTYRPLDVGDFDVANFTVTNAVNYLGVIHALAALLPSMRRRRSGHIAWIASVAGYRGLPKAAAYGPSKAALINLAESLKPELDADGVAVSLVNPGFVETPLTAQNDFRMPFLMSPETAAARIVAGLVRHQFEIAFPTRFIVLLKLARLLPYACYFRITRRLVKTRRTA
ncbi:MAG: SDR family NAD(P)-dependent oxidoreductase [Alphaproteobacteria bacterium]|nr:SDR family NAD(P)-dependent oxidoreductase [Alphaproteobacteria bacterium]